MVLQPTVNGEAHRLDPAPAPASLEAVIAALGHNPLLVVAEHNGSIAPRRLWATTRVKDHDSLEIVTIVGGGS